MTNITKVCYNKFHRSRYDLYIFVFILIPKSKKEATMSTKTASKEEKKIKSKFNDEFETYLKRQCLKTTFNGLELETFSWYKKMLGLV